VALTASILVPVSQFVFWVKVVVIVALAMIASLYNVSISKPHAVMTAFITNNRTTKLLFYSNSELHCTTVRVLMQPLMPIA